MEAVQEPKQEQAQNTREHYLSENLVAVVAVTVVGELTEKLFGY